MDETYHFANLKLFSEVQHKSHNNAYMLKQVIDQFLFSLMFHNKLDLFN